MRARVRWTALGLVVAAACATGGGGAPSSTVSPAGNETVTHMPGLPSDSLPGYVVHVVPMDSATLSAEALDPPSLESLLSGAGFQIGNEQTFTARDRPLTQVVTRVLRFRSAEGAGAYLAWLGVHGADLLGSRTLTADPPDLPGAIAFSHTPTGCCTKDTLQYFAAWIRGDYAITLLVGGPGADRRSAVRIAVALDANVRKEG